MGNRGIENRFADKLVEVKAQRPRSEGRSRPVSLHFQSGLLAGRNVELEFRPRDHSRETSSLTRILVTRRERRECVAGFDSTGLARLPINVGRERAGIDEHDHAGTIDLCETARERGPLGAAGPNDLHRTELKRRKEALVTFQHTEIPGLAGQDDLFDLFRKNFPCRCHDDQFKRHVFSSYPRESGEGPGLFDGALDVAHHVESLLR